MSILEWFKRWLRHFLELPPQVITVLVDPQLEPAPHIAPDVVADYHWTPIPRRCHLCAEFSQSYRQFNTGIFWCLDCLDKRQNTLGNL